MSHCKVSRCEGAGTGSPESPKEAGVVHQASWALAAKGAARTQVYGEVGAGERDLSAHVVDVDMGTRRMSVRGCLAERRNRWNESGGLSTSTSAPELSSGEVLRAVEETQGAGLDGRAAKPAEPAGGVEQDCRIPGRQGIACRAQSMIVFVQQRMGVVEQARLAHVVHFAGKGGMD